MDHLKTVDERRAHLRAIDKIRDEWLDGLITLAEKRERISEENIYYHGDHVHSLTTGRTLTGDTGEFAHVPSAAMERRELAAVQPTLDEEEEELWWKREPA